MLSLEAAKHQLEFKHHDEYMLRAAALQPRLEAALDKAKHSLEHLEDLQKQFNELFGSNEPLDVEHANGLITKLFFAGVKEPKHDTLL